MTLDQLEEAYHIGIHDREEFRRDVKSYANARALQIAEKAVGDILSRIKTEIGGK